MMDMEERHLKLSGSEDDERYSCQVLVDEFNKIIGQMAEELNVSREEALKIAREKLDK